MAERERRRADGRAYAGGAVAGAVAGAVTYGIIRGIGAVFNPIMRDITGSARVPDGGVWVFGIVAVVAGFVFVSRVRAGSGYVAADGSRVPSALDRVRRDISAERSGSRIQADGPVQRWSDDLLARVDRVEDEGLSDVQS